MLYKETGAVTTMMPLLYQLFIIADSIRRTLPDLPVSPCVCGLLPLPPWTWLQQEHL
jgi:hypothetical protein